MNYIINDHKLGFTLTSNIRNEINKIYNNKVKNLTFYKFWNINNKNDKYICFIRNPYEIIISGYLYHKKCREEWCIKQNVNYFNYWKDNHFSNEAKIQNKDLIDNSVFSKKETYQNILNTSPQELGIIHEMNNVSKITIDGMCEFNYYDFPNVKIIKMEDILSNFDKEIDELLSFFEINPDKKLLENLKKHNVKLQRNNPHVTNTDFLENRYINYFNDDLYKKFNIIHSNNLDKLKKFGYKIHL